MDQLSHFFQQNQSTLAENYPGINQNIYQQFIHSYQNQKRINLNFDPSSLKSLKEKMMAGAPFSYLLNSHYFYNHEMYVDENVLIPRFETELIVEEALNYIQASDKSEITIADICTGSGCIINALQIDAKKPLKGIAVDIDPAALAVAEYNHFLTDFLKSDQHEIIFLQGDLLKGIKQNFDLIISNPPYIKESEKKDVHSMVHYYEPHVALYLEDDKYDEWFNHFFQQVFSRLNPGGIFLMEGDANHLIKIYENAKNSATSLGSFYLQKDLTQKNRYLKFIKDKG